MVFGTRILKYCVLGPSGLQTPDSGFYFLGLSLAWPWGSKCCSEGWLVAGLCRAPIDSIYGSILRTYKIVGSGWLRYI